MDLILLIAWLHPLAMLLAIAAAGWVLTLGLKMRQARVRRTKRPKGWWTRHTQLGKGALVVGAVGAVLGPVAWYLRGQALLSTLHGRVGVATLAVGGVVWFLGRRLERGGKGRPVALHGVLGIGLALLAGVALLTGLELLP